MNLLVQTAMVFFGTLMMAGLVALHEPPYARSQAADKSAPVVVAAQQWRGAPGTQHTGGFRPAR